MLLRQHSLPMQLGVAQRSSKIIDGAIISEIFEQPGKIAPSKAAGQKAAVVGRVLGFTSEGREKTAEKELKKEEEERQKFLASTPKVILQSNAKRWSQMSDKIEAKMAKDPLARDGAKLGNQMYKNEAGKKKKKPKKDADVEPADAEEEPKKDKKKKSISKSLIKAEDEEPLGFGDLAVAGYDEETFGFEVEGTDDSTAKLLQNAGRSVDLGIEIVKGAFVVASVGETYAEEQARLKREAEQREKARIAAEQLAKTLRVEAAATAVREAKEKKAKEADALRVLATWLTHVRAEAKLNQFRNESKDENVCFKHLLDIFKFF